MKHNSELYSPPFKLIGVTKSDIKPIRNLIKAAKTLDSPYIVYKNTRLYTGQIEKVLELLSGFDLVVIPKETYVPD